MMSHGHWHGCLGIEPRTLKGSKDLGLCLYDRKNPVSQW